MRVNGCRPLCVGHATHWLHYTTVKSSVIEMAIGLSKTKTAHYPAAVRLVYNIYIFSLVLESVIFQGFTDDQLMLVEQNTVMVEEREREIRQIVQSISDLNEIFRDLAGMVVEQVFEANARQNNWLLIILWVQSLSYHRKNVHTQASATCENGKKISFYQSLITKRS